MCACETSSIGTSSLLLLLLPTNVNPIYVIYIWELCSILRYFLLGWNAHVLYSSESKQTTYTGLEMHLCRSFVCTEASYSNDWQDLRKNTEAVVRDVFDEFKWCLVDASRPEARIVSELLSNVVLPDMSECFNRTFRCWQPYSIDTIGERKSRHMNSARMVYWPDCDEFLDGASSERFTWGHCEHLHWIE